MAHEQPKKSIQQIVEEVASYPLDAFVFVQECVGIAAEHVHGTLTPNQSTVAHWMAQEDVSPEALQRLDQEHGLPPDVALALHRLGGPGRMNRHITGKDLCRTVRDTALSRWGLMARVVMARWNILRTEDIGTIIFALVDNGWLQKQPTDTFDDFVNIFTFDEAFDQAYQIGSS